MNTELATKKSVTDLVAERLNLSPELLKKTLKATAFRAEREVTDEEFTALMVIANAYKLNPITKELYAFPNRGGIVPIVSVDGWVRIVTEHPDYDGVELTENHTPDGKIDSVTARFHRKSNAHPTVVTEYMVECDRGTDVWKKWPRRMLRHKAYIQGARMAFGFSGIYDEDEALRIIEVTAKAEPEMPKAKTTEVIIDQPSITSSAAEILGAKPVDERPIPAGYVAIKAKYDGMCKNKDCGKEIKAGADSIFSAKNGLRHFDCA